MTHRLPPGLGVTRQRRNGVTATRFSLLGSRRGGPPARVKQNGDRKYRNTSDRFGKDPKDRFGSVWRLKISKFLMDFAIENWDFWKLWIFPLKIVSYPLITVCTCDWKLTKRIKTGFKKCHLSQTRVWKQQIHRKKSTEMPRYLVVSVLGYLRMMLYQSSCNWHQFSKPLDSAFVSCLSHLSSVRDVARCVQVLSHFHALHGRHTWHLASHHQEKPTVEGTRMESQLGFTRGFHQPTAPSSPIRCLQLSATAQCSNLAMASSQFFWGKKSMVVSCIISSKGLNCWALDWR